MGAGKQSRFAQVIEILPDRLRRYGEARREFVHHHATVLASERKNLLLAGREVQLGLPVGRSHNTALIGRWLILCFHYFSFCAILQRTIFRIFPVDAHLVSFDSRASFENGKRSSYQGG